MHGDGVYEAQNRFHQNTQHFQNHLRAAIHAIVTDRLVFLYDTALNIYAFFLTIFIACKATRIALVWAPKCAARSPDNPLRGVSSEPYQACLDEIHVV